MSNIINDPASSDRDILQATTIKMQAYAMKLDLLSNATVIDRAVRFVSSHKTGSKVICLKTWKYKHMKLQGLGKCLDRYDSQLGSNALAVLKELAFYNFQDSADVKIFNHVIGLPRQNGVAFPLFYYERLLYDTHCTSISTYGLRRRLV